MHYVIAYDTPDDKRRNKIVKIIDDFGSRVQFSVFEAILENDLIERMKDKLGKIINEKEDSIKIYKLCGNCEKNIEALGISKNIGKQEFIII